MIINQEFLYDLFEQAKESERLRLNYDLRTSENDGSQRMLNALLPGTEVAIHRHPRSSENIICLCGKMDVILLKEEKERVCVAEGFDKGMDAQDFICRQVLVEAERIHLCPANATYGCVVPAGIWHTIEVYDPSVIYEAKDGKYGEDGSEIYNGTSVSSSATPSTIPYDNDLGELKKNVEYIIGKECAEGNQEDLTAEYISRVLGADLNDVRAALMEINEL